MPDAGSGAVPTRGPVPVSLRTRRRPDRHDHVHVGPRTPRHRLRPDALHRAAADPVAGREPAAPVLLLQHRAARVVPRHRPRLPHGQARAAVALVVPAGPRAAGRRRAPGARRDRPGRQRHHLLHRAADLDRTPAGLHAHGRLRRRRGGAHRTRPARRPVLPRAAPPRRLPLRPDRQPRRHGPVRRHVVPVGAAGRVGRVPGGGHRGARPASALARRREPRRVRRRARRSARSRATSGRRTTRSRPTRAR